MLQIGGGRVMSVQCLACANLEDLRKTPQHAAVGWGRCPGDPPGTFVSIGTQRQCNKFRAAPAQVAEARVKWFNKLGI